LLGWLLGYGRGGANFVSVPRTGRSAAGLFGMRRDDVLRIPDAASVPLAWSCSTRTLSLGDRSKQEMLRAYIAVTEPCGLSEGELKSLLRS